MGQRSQIYVRYNKDENKKGLIAHYYQWCYGERMVSRARHTIEWLKEYMKYGHGSYVWRMTDTIKKLHMILDVNFDMKDIVLSTDIIKEFDKYKEPEDRFNSYVFQWQDNNDGKLLIDIYDKEIKYAFLDQNANPDNIMDAEAYMDWDNYNGESWSENPYLTKKAIRTCHNNIKWLSKHAILMNKNEVCNYLEYDYESDRDN